MTALLDTARYAAANAQVHALYTRMIDPFLWRRLLDAPDVPTLAALLQQAGIGHDDGVRGEDVDAASLERRLWTRLATLAWKPARLLNGNARDLLQWYWRRFELDNLKTILRAVHYGKAWSTVAPILIDLAGHSALPWRTLAEAGSVSALIDRLPDGSYARALDHARERYQREQSLFVLEAALDLMYSRRLQKLIEALHGRDRREADTYLGFQLDAQTLLWAYRFRDYAHLSPEEILNYTLHQGLRVDAEVVRAIALGAPLAATVHTVWGDRLLDAAVAEAPESGDPLASLELACMRHVVGQATHARGGYPLHLGTLLAFLVLLQAETQDLIAIIEGCAVGWPPARIRPYLVEARE